MPKLSEIIAPSFYGLHNDIKAGRHTFYKLAGGRGSCKSTFVGTEIPLGMMRDAQNGDFTNALALRHGAVDLKDSVYTQLLWAIDKLGVSHLWRANASPMRLTYLPTGQQILFRGADDPLKIKSIKAPKGYFKYLWFEELSEFEGPEKIRSIQQSILRGGPKFIVFYSYNPPRSQKAWVNDPTVFTMPDMVESCTTYLTVPREWLGERFFLDAEHLKKVKPEAYEHEYMGVATGTGGEVFTNVTIRKIMDDEIRAMPRHRYGIDWGYATDPFVWLAMGYDRKHRKLYIYDEIYGAGIKLYKIAELIRKHGGERADTIADSEDARANEKLKALGIRVRSAKKGPGSVDSGTKWLQDLDEIIIDDTRCPNAAREFYEYELDRDAKGNIKPEYPDHDNHCIDAARYGCEDDMQASGWGIAHIKF